MRTDNRTASAPSDAPTADVEPVETYVREAQLFGFTPLSVCDSIVNAVNDILYDGVDGVQRALREKGILPATNEEEATRRMNLFLGKLQDAVDDSFDRFELYVLNNVLRVPLNARLPGDTAIAAAPSADEDAALCEQVVHARSKLRQMRAFGQALRSEMEAVTAMERLLSIRSAHLDAFAAVCKQHQGTTVSTAAAVALHAQRHRCALTAAGLFRHTVYPLSESVAFLCDDARQTIETVAQLERKSAAPLSATAQMAPGEEADACDVENDYAMRRNQLGGASVEQLKILAESL